MRYRLIDVRIWGDRKFMQLSPLKPSGQALFLYLLTNPNTNSIPGLYRAGAAAMAEELGWVLKDFQEAFQEVLNQGLAKADLQARLIFIPNAMKYNKPQSPNVVKSWSTHWDELPECGLKFIAYQALKAFVEGLGEGYSKAFNKSIAKTTPNQEQDQEQDQEINIPQVADTTLPVSSNENKKTKAHETSLAKNGIEADLSCDKASGNTIVAAEYENGSMDLKLSQNENNNLWVDPVDEIFSYWQIVMNHPKAKLDQKRRRKINNALTNLKFSKDELKQAINGCANSPYHMGDNKQKLRYDSIDLIFRDAEHIEKFIESAQDKNNIANIGCGLPGVSAPDRSLFEGAL